MTSTEDFIVVVLHHGPGHQFARKTGKTWALNPSLDEASKLDEAAARQLATEVGRVNVAVVRNATEYAMEKQVELTQVSAILSRLPAEVSARVTEALSSSTLACSHTPETSADLLDGNTSD